MEFVKQHSAKIVLAFAVAWAVSNIGVIVAAVLL